MHLWMILFTWVEKQLDNPRPLCLKSGKRGGNEAEIFSVIGGGLKHNHGQMLSAR